MTNPLVVRAQSREPISYTLRFPEPHSHYIEVEALIPSTDQATIDLMMPIWTPGSYFVREFAKNVENITARTPSGSELIIKSTRKNRWVVEASGSEPIILSYRVYSHEMSVRTNWVDSDFALVNGAPTFITTADLKPRPHDVTVELPPGWSRSVTALPPTPSDQPHSYRAVNFDTLIDSPIVVGNPDIYEFTVDDTPHYLVNVGDHGIWDGTRSAHDVELIVRQQHELWGSIPYDRYVILNLITESGGGLEHKDSTVVMSSRWQMQDRQDYLDWLTLVSHEIFHAWNVKRLRPIELGPFDYEQEVHTRSLWAVEGLAVYYGALLVHRAGLSSRDEYFTSLSNEIRRLQTTPGRLVQTLEQASYDAWIKFYRPNENSRNTTVSYYTKGAVISFLLDAKIRRMTGGTRTLDDVMRLAYGRYSGTHGYTPEQLRATTEDALGIDVDLNPWFDQVLDSVDELDYSEALDWFGLNLTTSDSMETSTAEERIPGWIGLTPRMSDDDLIVTQVTRGTPGFEAGFNVGDEILAIDGYRVRANSWNSRLQQYGVGDEASVLVARRERLLPLRVVFGKKPDTLWKLEPRTVQTNSQGYRVDSWLGERP